MARSFMVAVARAAREAERQQSARQREIERAARESERRHNTLARQLDRSARQAEKAEAQAYLEERKGEAAELTRDADNQVAMLQGILTATPRSAAMGTVSVAGPEEVCEIVFDRLREEFEPRPYQATHTLPPMPPEPLESWFRIKEPPPPTFVASLFGGKAKHAKAVSDARAEGLCQFRSALDRWRVKVDEWEARKRELEQVAARQQAEHAEAEARRRQDVAQDNAGIDEWEAAVHARDPDALVQYLTHILDSSDYPEEFDERYRAAYSPESKALVVEYVLPDPDVVPLVREYAYVKATDDFKEKLRPQAERATIYRTAIAALVLRTIREIFFAGPAAILDVITFNGVLDTIDPATGLAVSPCVISVRTTRDQFMGINLARVEPVACLASLGASVSRRPEELAPVRPIIEFEMADRRFVAGSDILDGLEGLDERPNIMDLSPTEFEVLVANLFTRMGLEAKLTRASRDGGVDCVAFDPRPIFGGKVVIQAKRYRHTVGVSAVRDLYGTMQHEGANKGILVTTSGYGPDAYAFAKTKPVELLDGGNLLFLLEQHGVAARIVMPPSV